MENFEIIPRKLQNMQLFIIQFWDTTGISDQVKLNKKLEKNYVDSTLNY